MNRWVKNLLAFVGKWFRSPTITIRFKKTGYTKEPTPEKETQEEMGLVLQRTTFTDESTIGCLFIDQKFQCYTLEDSCRKVKVYGKTAIWAGRYKIELRESPTFGNCYGWEKLPYLLDIPLFDGVCFHPLNTPKETKGCIGPGTTKGRNIVHRSQLAFDRLMPKIIKMLDDGELWISIIGGNHYQGGNNEDHRQ